MAMDIYTNGLYKLARMPEDIGRKDWHHNPEGQVDYLPLGCKGTSIGVPLDEQKYDYETERQYEEAALNLCIYKERKPDWKEYDRIQHEFN